MAGVAGPKQGGIEMSAPYHSEAVYKTETEPYQSVGGWLLVFIILLIFVSPVVTTIINLFAFIIAARINIYLPLITFFTIVDILLSALLSCFGIVTGILLWRKSSRATGVAKVYLSLRIFYSVFILCVIGLSMEISDLPPSLKEVLPRWILLNSLPSAIFVMIWYAYFKKSERVKATYGDPQDDYLTLNLT
jgi:hypothetical protein